MSRKTQAITADALCSTQRVLLVDSQLSRLPLLESALLDSGYELLEILSDVSRIASTVTECQPDVLIIGMDVPDRKVLDETKALRKVAPIPVIVFAETDSPEMIEHAISVGVNAFIVNDIQTERMPSIINVAMARFRAQQGLMKELETAKSKLAERKIIDRAKGLLMAQKGLSEDQAYSSLRKMAMDRGQSMAEVAESIIVVLHMLES